MKVYRDIGLEKSMGYNIKAVDLEDIEKKYASMVDIIRLCNMCEDVVLLCGYQSKLPRGVSYTKGKHGLSLPTVFVLVPNNLTTTTKLKFLQVHYKPCGNNFKITF